MSDADPNEAYEVIPMPDHPRGPRGGWWTVTCNGVPVRHFSPERRDLADRYATDPAYRASLKVTKYHEKSRRDWNPKRGRAVLHAGFASYHATRNGDKRAQIAARQAEELSRHLPGRTVVDMSEVRELFERMKWAAALSIGFFYSLARRPEQPEHQEHFSGADGQQDNYGFQLLAWLTRQPRLFTLLFERPTRFLIDIHLGYFVRYATQTNIANVSNRIAPTAIQSLGHWSGGYMPTNQSVIFLSPAEPLFPRFSVKGNWRLSDTLETV
jgi:hypothetical protein